MALPRAGCMRPGPRLSFPHVRIPRLARTATAALIAGGVALIAASGGTADVSPASLRCTALTDAVAIDAQLAGAGSPLAGDGAAFVREGMANGIDPRFIVAVAAHETMLETYGPAQGIHNPFGLGPGIRFADESQAIAMAGRTLRRYADDGLVTIPAIAARWAPVGADNDPGALNDSWPSGVGAYYAAIGGDPARAVLASAQDPSPTCAPAAATAAPVTPSASIIPAITPTDGPAVITVWGGAMPTASGPSMREGGDPRTGRPATLPDFVFPVAPPAGSPVRYDDAGDRPVVISTAPGVLVVAPIAGRLRVATAAQQGDGIGSWIVAPGGDRVGLGPLASYEPGIEEGVVVTPGQPLGNGTGTLAVAWRRGGVDMGAYPMLAATRAPG